VGLLRKMDRWERLPALIAVRRMATTAISRSLKFKLPGGQSPGGSTQRASRLVATARDGLVARGLLRSDRSEPWKKAISANRRPEPAMEPAVFVRHSLICDPHSAEARQRAQA